MKIEAHNVEVARVGGRDTVVGRDPVARGRLARAVGDNVGTVALQHGLAGVAVARDCRNVRYDGQLRYRQQGHTGIPGLEEVASVGRRVRVDRHGHYSVLAQTGGRVCRRRDSRWLRYDLAVAPLTGVGRARPRSSTGAASAHEARARTTASETMARVGRRQRASTLSSARRLQLVLICRVRRHCDSPAWPRCASAGTNVVLGAGRFVHSAAAAGSDHLA